MYLVPTLVPTMESKWYQFLLSKVPTVPDHDGGRPMEVNACILIAHMVYL